MHGAGPAAVALLRHGRRRGGRPVAGWERRQPVHGVPDTGRLTPVARLLFHVRHLSLGGGRRRERANPSTATFGRYVDESRKHSLTNVQDGRRERGRAASRGAHPGREQPARRLPHHAQYHVAPEQHVVDQVHSEGLHRAGLPKPKQQ